MMHFEIDRLIFSDLIVNERIIDKCVSVSACRINA